jgi:hypothetical protein
VAVHVHDLWTLQRSSDVLDVNRDCPKRSHLWVMSRVPGRRDHDWPHAPHSPAKPAESVPAVQEARLMLNLEECQLFQKAVRCLEHVVTWGDNHRFREAEIRTGMADHEE